MKNFINPKRELQISAKGIRMGTTKLMIDGPQPTIPAQPTAPTTQSAAPAPVVQTKLIGKYKVEVIRDKCIGAASCVAIAPGVFKLDEENIATIIDQNGADDEMKLLAAQSCPTAAIIVTDTSTGQQVWPPTV